MLGHAPPPLAASGLDMHGGHPARSWLRSAGHQVEVLTPRRQSSRRSRSLPLNAWTASRRRRSGLQVCRSFSSAPRCAGSCVLPRTAPIGGPPRVNEGAGEVAERWRTAPRHRPGVTRRAVAETGHRRRSHKNMPNRRRASSTSQQPHACDRQEATQTGDCACCTAPEENIGKSQLFEGFNRPSIHA